MEVNELSCKDLMVGDWVIPHIYDAALEPSKIVGIHYNSYKGKDYVDWVDCDVWDELSLNDIKPIPLTPEILEKNGFVENRGITSWKFETDREDLIDIYGVKDYHLSINIEDTHGSGKGYRWMLNNLTIFYVHQLQHALRLCGIEKTIEL